MKAWFIALIIPFLVGCNEKDDSESSDAPKAAVPSPSIDNRITLDERLNEWAAGAVAVKAVVFDCAEGNSRPGSATQRPVVEDGVEHPYIVKDASVFLTTADAASLADLVTGQHEPPSTAGCYVPHHGFIFYAEDDSIIAHIEVCLLCRHGSAIPGQGLAEYWDIEGLAEFIRQIGLPVFEEAVEWPPYFSQNLKVESGRREVLTPAPHTTGHTDP